jgi:hypothetical protein
MDHQKSNPICEQSDHSTDCVGNREKTDCFYFESKILDELFEGVEMGFILAISLVIEEVCEPSKWEILCNLNTFLKNNSHINEHQTQQRSLKTTKINIIFTQSSTTKNSPT